jgi:hypothetical protein
MKLLLLVVALAIGALTFAGVASAGWTWTDDASGWTWTDDAPTAAE